MACADDADRPMFTRHATGVSTERGVNCGREWEMAWDNDDNTSEWNLQQVSRDQVESEREMRCGAA